LCRGAAVRLRDGAAGRWRVDQHADVELVGSSIAAARSAASPVPITRQRPAER
jgi:hypothetical protein